MASSSSLADDLTCSVCLSIFTEPVMLYCGHSFCRECITLSLKSAPQCPQCRSAVDTKETQLLTNHTLKSLVEKVKETARLKEEHGNDRQGASMCPEHEEKLKLFCVTDQQLACIICRDGEKHENHKFKPVKEAAASLQRELETFVQTVSREIEAVEGLTSAQQQEIEESQQKSGKLMAQIKGQFQEMHKFLREKEDEITDELKKKQEVNLENMRKSLSAMEAALTETKELKEKVTSVQSISDAETLLKHWAEDKTTITAQQSFQPRSPKLRVAKSSLTFWPHETHLQLSVWKDMIQMIKPRLEHLSFKTDSPHVVTLDGGRRFYSQYKKPSYSRADDYDRDSWGRRAALTCPPEVQHSNVFSTDQFRSGQHYWEIHVGDRRYWEVGVEGNFLKYDGSKYTICNGKKSRAVQFKTKPERIGVYLNCSTDEVSFCDADNIKDVHTEISRAKKKPVSAYLSTGTDTDYSNMTVCCYKA